MEFPIQAKPVERQAYSNNDGKGSIHQSDCLFVEPNAALEPALLVRSALAIVREFASRISGNADWASHLSSEIAQS